jgi:hypothetical protein
VPSNPNALYVGGSDDPKITVGSKVWVRIGAPPAPLVRSLSYPGTLPVRSITIDPRHSDHAFVVDAATVYQTSDAGVSWSTVTGNLGSFDPSTLRTVTFARTPYGDAVVVGTMRGIYFATARSGYADWNLLGSFLPTAPVLSLRYDPRSDRLTAGTLGRGVFTLSNVGVGVLLAN